MALRTLLSTALLVPHVASNGCCFESESFWDDLDDATATPRGAASHPDALLPRLCPRPAAAALGPEPGFARCVAGEASALHLLLHVNKRASWQRLIPMPPQHERASQYLNHLPALASLRLIHSRRIRIFYCVPPGWQGHSVSKSTLSRVDCAHDTDMFFELGRGWADAMADWPQPPKGLSRIHLRVALETQGVRTVVGVSMSHEQVLLPYYRRKPSTRHDARSRTASAVMHMEDSYPAATLSTQSGRGRERPAVTRPDPSMRTSRASGSSSWRSKQPSQSASARACKQATVKQSPAGRAHLGRGGQGGALVRDGLGRSRFDRKRLRARREEGLVEEREEDGRHREDKQVEEP